MNNIIEATINDLYKFYIAFVVSHFEDLVEPYHIYNLSKHLTCLAYNDEYPNRLCVAMPPQHSKSSMVTLAYSVWLIIRNPNLRILIVNAEKELSIQFGIQIRNLLYNLEPYFGLKVSNVKGSSTHLMFEKNGELQLGEIRLTGAKGSITGHPVDIMIVDDPYKGDEDEFTPTQLQKKWNWYTTLIEQRLRTHSKLVLLHTRWHSEDIQGRILGDDYQRSKYGFVEYPAIDENNTPLWDGYYDLDFYRDKQRTMGERRFQAIYQQKPLDLTSNFFHMDKLIFEDRFDDYVTGRVRSWDIASSDDQLGDQRDYTVGVRMLRTARDDYWIFPYIRGQYGNNVKNIIYETARQDKANHTILLEPGTTGGASKLLFEEYKRALMGYNVIQSLPQGTKSDRATPLANAIYDGKVHVFINDNNLRETFIQEFQSFPNGKHDDIVDACSYAYNYLSKHEDDLIRTAGHRKRKRL